MSLRSIRVLLLGLPALLLVGCEPTPVVVNPDEEGGTTVIEERDIEVVPKDAAPPPDSDSGTDVKVDVGGGEGINVDVDRQDESNP